MNWKEKFSDSGPIYFPPFGWIEFPYHKMGNVTSADLFTEHELAAFQFYWTNRHRYYKVLDIGANIGLHSIVMSRCGFKVLAYEPDPEHNDILLNNLRINGCGNVQTWKMAVSDRTGTADFTRVLDNGTANHLSGEKAPYGPLQEIRVQTVALDFILNCVDLIKIDAEGHEVAILKSTCRSHWNLLEALVEVGSSENAQAIYEWAQVIGVKLSKLGGPQITVPEEMPMSHHDGMLFIS